MLSLLLFVLFLLANEPVFLGFESAQPLFPSIAFLGDFNEDFFKRGVAHSNIVYHFLEVEIFFIKPTRLTSIKFKRKEQVKEWKLKLLEELADFLSIREGNHVQNGASGLINQTGFRDVILDRSFDLLARPVFPFS